MKVGRNMLINITSHSLLYFFVYYTLLSLITSSYFIKLLTQRNTSQDSKRTYAKITKAICMVVCHDFFAKGRKISRVARKHRLSDSAVDSINTRFRLTGTVEYKKRGGARNVKIKNIHSDFLRDLIDKQPEGNILGLGKLKEKLMDRFPEDFPNEKSISIAAIHNHVKDHLKPTLKRTSPQEMAHLQPDTDEKRR